MTADCDEEKENDDIDVKAAREEAVLTEETFALRDGFNLARLRDPEQKRTRPDAVVRAYLPVIRKNPKAVKEALAARSFGWTEKGTNVLFRPRSAW